MTAIVFNGRDAIKWGTTNVDSVYVGSVLVWSASGLPYTTPDVSSISVAPWTPAGQFRRITLGGAVAYTGTGSAYHGTVKAYNVKVSANCITNGVSDYCDLMLRRNGNSYYIGRIQEGSKTNPVGGTAKTFILKIIKVINGTQTVLGSWTGEPYASVPNVYSFTAVGTTLTIQRGAVVHSVVDATLTAPGQIGVAASADAGFYSVTVTAA